MKLNLKLAGNIIFVIGLGISIYFLFQAYFAPVERLKYYSFNLSNSIVGLVLMVIGYLIIYISKKSKAKQTPS